MIRSSVSEALLHSEGEGAQHTKGVRIGNGYRPNGGYDLDTFQEDWIVGHKVCKGTSASKTLSKTRARDAYDTKCSELSGEI